MRMHNAVKCGLWFGFNEAARRTAFLETPPKHHHRNTGNRFDLEYGKYR
ncbi:MAG: hypothetical protein LBH00_10910 [Planctomycetaceae bacterium]|nr:hypothetical protein [Planctomycetaceae bacterium]